VRLTAAVALKDCLDVCNFLAYTTFNIIILQSVSIKPECFAPFLPTAVSELVRLLGEADTFNSKRRIDHSLNVLIEQAGERVAILLVSLPYYSLASS
jgi:hypothetical protein